MTEQMKSFPFLPVVERSASLCSNPFDGTVRAKVNALEEAIKKENPELEKTIDTVTAGAVFFMVGGPAAVEVAVRQAIYFVLHDIMEQDRTNQEEQCSTPSS